MYYEVFRELCEKRGCTAADVSRGTGISTATLSSWKNGKYTPKANKLQKIADYFEVPIDVFFGVQNNGQDEEYYLDAEARELAELMHKNPEYKTLFSASRNLSKEDLQFVLDMIERMS